MIKKIPEAELKVMKFIWKMNKSVSSKEVIIAMEEQFSWKQTTTLTLLARLVKKRFLSSEKIDRFTHYTVLIGEEEYKNFETKNFFGIIHDNSKESLMASLYADDIVSEETLEFFNEDFNKTKDDE